ncbi:MAG: MFS transporter [Desulfobacterales bacterium]|nr:MFS transporter [Desulfobacterales bacterium]
MSDSGLSMKVKLGYGICDLGGNLFFTITAFLLLNYLTDTVGIRPGPAAFIVMGGKLWDALTDPLAGYLSDRTRTRWGRRRPYLIFGAFPLFAAMVFMFTAPGFTSQPLLFAWGMFAYCLLSTAYTLVNIPYSALTPDLTGDFNERTSLNAYRFGFAAVGTLAGAGAALPLIHLFPDKASGYTGMAVVFGLIMMITSLITGVTVREPSRPRELPGAGFWATYIKVFRNRPFVIILATYALHITALTVVSGIAIYYFKYIHHDESLTTTAMLTLLVTAMAFIPVSVALARRVGKKAVYGAGLLILGLAVMILFFFGHTMAPDFSFLVMGGAGIGMGLTYAIPYAMVPDAIDYDYLKTGEKKEGAFYGIWTFGFKTGQALALGITGGILSLTGYVPGEVQSPETLLGIRLLLGPVAAGIFLLAIVTLVFYPITANRFARIRAGIARRDTGQAHRE